MSETVESTALERLFVRALLVRACEAPVREGETREQVSDDLLTAALKLG